MKNIKYALLSAVLTLSVLTLTSCMDDMNGDRNSTGNITDNSNGHISSAEGSIPDGDDIISSVEDFVSDVVSDVSDAISDAVG